MFEDLVPRYMHEQYWMLVVVSPLHQYIEGALYRIDFT